MKNVLLMTASIIVDKNMMFHKHIPEKERLKQYIDAILFYITKSDFTDIIFVDGSGYNVNELTFLKVLAQIYDKNIEFLKFLNDQKKVVEHGKGYGEQKIIEYAIIHSEIIKNYKSFYKVTGRYIVKNINNILEKEYDSTNCFFKASILDKSLCNTAFFKVDKKFFKKFLRGIGDKVFDRKGLYLEHIYMKILKKHKEISCFKNLPIFIGTAGGDGKTLQLNPFFKNIKQICNFIGLHKIK